MSYSEFILSLENVHGVSWLQKNMIQRLDEFCPAISNEMKIFLTALLVLEDDGNTLISCDLEKASQKWAVKWNSLCAMNENALVEQNAGDLKGEFKKALAEIVGGKYPELVGGKLDARPFICEENSLYIQKYFAAKLNIERKIAELFPSTTSKTERSELESLRSEIKGLAGIEFNSEQLEAVTRGKNENLIITGGPGTGKTTVAFYILCALLKKEEFKDCAVYLAAPSGKAADRMQESIGNSLARIKENERNGDDKSVYDKIAKLEGATIHRLLNFRPQENGFHYNSQNLFPKESIFIIDEASMIDISLFANLLSAIPRGARIFLLGDKDQLPSVEAGAVLGELLAQKKDSVVELSISRRFNADSAIGNLAKYINDPSENTLQDRFSFWQKDLLHIKENSIQLIEMPAEFQLKKDGVQQVANFWAATFYRDLAACAKNVNVPENRESLLEDENCKSLWAFVERSRILCAEREGLCGVNALNLAILNSVLGSMSDEVGKIVMLNQNQSAYKLYNGDTGVIVKNADGIKFIMFKKSLRFVFYTLSSFPAKNVDTAFAITVHKAQGSEFDSVLLFLPDKKEHPLFNKQIIYTGVTRAKKYAAVISNADSFAKGIVKTITRDTGIVISR
ncbi:MAG: exodeoxyribonuclease V subunit alpha [Fibrobacteraceae bacterium]|nr:exodeoxyribonuclease V subunit alpha [Fibrobacteraceae bacterium]